MTTGSPPANGLGKAAEGRPRRAHKLLLGVACANVAANICCFQLLAASIAAAVESSRSAAGLVATMTQLGYGVGLILVVPLTDFLENRRLIGITAVRSIAAPLAAPTSGSAAILLPAALAVCIGAVTVQLAVVCAAHMASDEERGRVIGLVTSGLMVGVMLSRSMAGEVSQLSS